MEVFDKRPLPRSLNFFSTYLCNSRCVNCGIWQNKEPAKPEEELSARDLEKLFADPLAREVRDVGFAGGEPTLTGFMERAMASVPQDLRVTVTTNALSPARLFRVLETPRPGGWFVQVSMDGLNATNDTLRGVPGAYDKAVTLLRALGERNIPRLISFTINKVNYGEIADMAELAQSLGAGFSMRLAHLGGAYKNMDRREQFDLSPEELDAVEASLAPIIRAELANPDHNPARLVFLQNIVPYARGEVKDPACYAMDTGLVLDCYGGVFPNCPQMMHAVGNIKEQSLSDIWAAGPANGMRCRIEQLLCGGCWNDCQVPANIELDHDFLLAQYGAMKRELAGGLNVRELDWESPSAALALLGFHSVEGDPGARFRWTTGRFSFLVPAGVTTIQLQAGPPPGTGSTAPLEAALRIDGKAAGAVVYESGEWTPKTFSLDAPTSTMGVAEVVLERTFCPRREGASSDSRELGLALGGVCFK